MRTIRIYQPGKYHAEEEQILSQQATRHITTVLRLRPDAWLQLFNGEGWQCPARILRATRKEVRVRLAEPEQRSLESPLAIHLAQVISKGDRMEWVIQKAVELGVHRITPLYSTRCVVKRDPERMAKKLAQWHALAINACEQCGRNYLPLIYSPTDFADFIQEANTCPQKFILVPGVAAQLRQLPLQNVPSALLIGPEGGLTDEEITQAQLHDFSPLSLGPRILRTETAAIAAIALLQGQLGDL